MQPPDSTVTTYDPTTRFFHWATALLVVTQWAGGQTIDWFPSGPLRVDARSVHITAGVLLTILLAARIIWRLTRGRRLPPADRGALNVLAKSTHWGLYALLVAMVLVGLFLTWARGDNIFNLFKIPQYQPGRTLANQVLELHATIAWVILALAGLHAAAAIVHRLLWHDSVLGRMWPRFGLTAKQDPPSR